MTKARHSPWLDDRAALLVSLLAHQRNLTVSEDIAHQDISDDLDHIARRTDGSNSLKGNRFKDNHG